jgi:hypothetical protein
VVIWYILWPFSTLFGQLVYFSRFGMLYQEKSGIPRPTYVRGHWFSTVPAEIVMKDHFFSFENGEKKLFAALL